MERASKERGDGYVNLALLTDGLRAEREQGITIDVAYRYFQTAAAQVRPGRHPRPRAVHAQHGHRRLDRRRGADPGGRAQRAWSSSRAATRYIAALLRIPHVVVCVNKMDLVDFDEAVFDAVVAREFPEARR